jgi:hypothetical protein
MIIKEFFGHRGDFLIEKLENCYGMSLCDETLDLGFPDMADLMVKK